MPASSTSSRGSVGCALKLLRKDNGTPLARGLTASATPVVDSMDRVAAILDRRQIPINEPGPPGHLPGHVPRAWGWGSPRSKSVLRRLRADLGVSVPFRPTHYGQTEDEQVAKFMAAGLASFRPERRAGILAARRGALPGTGRCVMKGNGHRRKPADYHQVQQITRCPVLEDRPVRPGHWVKVKDLEGGELGCDLSGKVRRVKSLTCSITTPDQKRARWLYHFDDGRCLGVEMIERFATEDEVRRHHGAGATMSPPTFAELFREPSTLDDDSVFVSREAHPTREAAAAAITASLGWIVDPADLKEEWMEWCAAGDDDSGDLEPGEMAWFTGARGFGTEPIWICRP